MEFYGILLFFGGYPFEIANEIGGGIFDLTVDDCIEQECEQSGDLLRGRIAASDEVAAADGEL